MTGDLPVEVTTSFELIRKAVVMTASPTVSTEQALRVLHAYKVYRPEVDGGIPEVIHTLTTPVSSEIESKVLVCRLGGFHREYQLDGVPVTACSSFGTLLSMPISPSFLGRMISQSTGVDVVVHHAPFPLNDIAVAGLGKHQAVVVHWHAEIVGRRLLKTMLAPLIRNALRRADAIVVSHPAMIDDSDFLVPFRDKCVCIPYGVDLDFWMMLPPDEQNLVAELRSRYPRLVVAVGRLVPYKGYTVLLRALKGLDVHLVIFGEGPQLSELQRLADELGVSGSVTFAGRRSREVIRQHLYAAKAMVLASISKAEAFGLVQAEAMGGRLPVINTNLDTAVPWVARDGIEGLTVQSGDPLGLREALRRVLEDADLRERLGEAGRRRAEAEFSRSVFRKRSLDLYRTIRAARTGR